MKWFSGMKIRVKLFLIFGIVMLIVACVTAFSIRSFNSVIDRYDELITNTLERRSYVISANEAFATMRLINSWRVLGAHHAVPIAETPDYYLHEQVFLGALSTYRRLLIEAYVRLYTGGLAVRMDILDSIDELYEEYARLSAMLYAAAANDGTDADLYEIYSIYSQILPLGTCIVLHLQEIMDLVNARAELVSADVYAYAGRGTRIVIIVTVTSVALAFLFLLFTSAVITEPIKKLQAAATQIAAGNFEHPIRSDMPDEIGTLANNIADMVDSILEASERERQAEEESLAKTRFLARMSHEIRTPMNAVLGITEIQLQSESHPPETEEAFLRIYSSSSLLLTIINDILDLSKIEAEKMEVIPAQYEIASLITDVVQLNLMQIGSKSVEFKLEIDDGLPAHFVGDELRNKQILNNLLSNAFKYTQAGRVTLSFSAEKSVEEDGAILVIRVQDTGQGMTQEQIDGLFEIEFTRFNLQSNRAIEGSGLGMMICHQLIQIMHGSISVESEVGKGSTFTVRIPQGRRGNELLASETIGSLQRLEVSQKSLRNIARLVREPMPYGKVLVVDDVESNLYVAKNFLMPYKITVHTAANGYEAIEKVKRGEVYDIIFMDHMMPGMDGIETARAIRETGYDHPIIALTANTFNGVKEIFLNNGFSGFISKPIDLNLLNSYLVRFVRGKQSAETVDAPSSESSVEPNISLSKSFLADARNALGILEPLAQTGTFGAEELKSIAFQSHAMKSAFSNIGRGDLSAYATVMEAAAKKADLQTLKAFALRFTDILREVIEEVHVGGAVGSDSPQIPAERLGRAELLAILEELEPLLESGNIEYMKYADRLRGEPECAELVAHMYSFDAPQAAETLARIKTKQEK